MLQDTPVEARQLPSFKQAAIEVLKAARKPLHYEEITRVALDKSLIETSGATPEKTMFTQLYRDTAKKKEKSAFIRLEQGLFSLNPEYKELDQKEPEREELDEESISTQYVGKAGEYRVASELLFKGFNASIMSVDEGLDIVATKNDKLYNIQVKTSNANKFDSYVIDLRISSFEKHNRGNTFSIFVLRSSDDTTFVILPYIEIEKNVHEQNILIVGNKTRYRFNLKIRDNKVFLGNLQNNISFFKDNWDVIR